MSGAGSWKKSHLIQRGSGPKGVRSKGGPKPKGVRAKRGSDQKGVQIKVGQVWNNSVLSKSIVPFGGPPPTPNHKSYVLKCYDCLLFSRIINLYLLVVVFELLVVRKRSRFLSAVIVNKKTKPDSGRVQCCCGGIFLPCFFWRNTLSCITPKENWYVYLMPFRIACYTHKHE